MKNKKITQAIKDILWMARRYANGRQTYAVSMFNDAYDTLRTEFGESVDSPSEERHETPDYPYATDGGGKIFNEDLKRRPYFQNRTEILETSTENMLKEIIERAIKNGWRTGLTIEQIIKTIHPYALLFQHDFIKAYWGESSSCIFCGSQKTISRTSFDGEITEYFELCSVCNGEVSEETTIPAYLYHLQKAVIEKNPIKYIYLTPA